MKKKTISKLRLIICSLMILSMFGVGVVFANNFSNNLNFTEEKNYDYIDITPHCVCKANLSVDSTVVDINLIKNSAALGGRENWQKNEQIEIKIKSTDGNSHLLKAGIIPAENMNDGYSYDSYGFPIYKEVMVESQERTLVFEVPKDGEYGFYVEDLNNCHSKNDEIVESKKEISNTSDTIEKTVNNVFNKENKECLSISIEINKQFKNPLNR